jgi:conjugative relaxase-like TrwC/TraI family protein
LTKGAASAAYYEQAVASGREDYYAGEGEAAGAWVGAGAKDLGLQGRVERGQLERLLVGLENPASGVDLTAGRVGRPTEVLGFDLTFSAPKSVSVLYAAGGSEVAARVVVAHEAAVRDALGYLEREAVQVRRGIDGRLREHAPGFVAAAYRHRSSRAGDPQLHTHVVAANFAQGADGRWTALHGTALYEAAKTAGFLYQARLRAELSRRLGVEWRVVVNGMAEIDGIPESVLKHFSRRSVEIGEALEPSGLSSPRAAQIAALATRRAKDYGVAESTIYQRWRARAAEQGLTRDVLARVLARDPAAVSDADVARAGAFVAGDDGLTARASTFTRSDAVRAWCEHYRQGASVARVERVADRWLAGDGVVALRGREPVVRDRAGECVLDDPARYSTPSMLAVEAQLIDNARQRRDADVGLARAQQLGQALARRPYLSDEQRELVWRLTRAGHGVEVIRAKAGSGKTTALDAAREAWQHSGVSVVGCALSAQAAGELRDVGIQATTIARLRYGLERRGVELPHRGVVIVDEAGMVGTRDLAFLAERAAKAEAKLVLVGDDHQLPEIDAGGAFRGLADRLGAIELTQNRRQQDPADVASLDALRRGDARGFAEDLHRRGNLTVSPTIAETHAALARDWWDGAQKDGVDQVVMITLRRQDARELNDHARALMRDAGRLGPDQLDIDGRRYGVGDRIICRHNDRRLGVVNGTRAQITRIDAREGIDARLDDGHDVHLPLDYASSRPRGRPAVDHAYATTAHSLQGATVQRSYILASQESYREWGYTAYSRHRHSASFYATRDAVADGPGGSEHSRLASWMSRSRAQDLAQDVADVAFDR